MRESLAPRPLPRPAWRDGRETSAAVPPPLRRQLGFSGSGRSNRIDRPRATCELLESAALCLRRRKEEEQEHSLPPPRILTRGVPPEVPRGPRRPENRERPKASRRHPKT